MRMAFPVVPSFRRGARTAVSPKMDALSDSTSTGDFGSAIEDVTKTGDWSSGMIRASGARGPEFDKCLGGISLTSRITPHTVLYDVCLSSPSMSYEGVRKYR